MTDTIFLVSHRPPASRRARAVAGVVAAVVFVVALVCVATLFGGPSAPGSGRTTTPQWNPVPISQDIAADQS